MSEPLVLNTEIRCGMVMGGQTGDAVRATAQRMESAGLDSIWVGDHVSFFIPIMESLTLLSFVAGAAFGYRVLFPPAVHFLLTFGSDVATPFIRIGNYVNLMLSLLFWMGVLFETPVVLFFLAKIGVVTPEFLGRHRRYAVVIAFILGALITPTFDPINQALVAIPVIVLYEISIWLTKLARPDRKRKELEPTTD